MNMNTLIDPAIWDVRMLNCMLQESWSLLDHDEDGVWIEMWPWVDWMIFQSSHLVAIAIRAKALRELPLFPDRIVLSRN